MKKARILLADDHAVLRQGLRHLISAEPDMEVVGEAADGAEVLPLVAKLKPDVIVMDLTMTGMSGAEATRQVKGRNEACNVLVLTVHEDRNYLREVLEAGAHGYMLKRAGPDELIQAIRATAKGTVFIDSRIAPQLLNVIVNDDAAGREGQTGSPELTRREHDVMRYIAEGFSNKEIAAALDLSVKTVETYKARAMEKLGISSRVEIVRLARRRKWPPVE